MSRFTVFALGIMPYISASIIMQLLSIVSPQMEAMKKEGEVGTPQDHPVHPLGTVLLAYCSRRSVSPSRWSRRQGWYSIRVMAFRFTTVVTLMTGTMFLMWLGEQITERGLGNGISIIIFAGIAAGLPNALGGLFELVRTVR